MKVDRLETHDRYLEFGKQNDLISQGVSECISKVPDAVTFPFYVFGHIRTLGVDEKFAYCVQYGWDNIPEARLIWQPRITKPIPESNSYLFLCRKGTDIVETIWVIPKEELFNEFGPEKMSHDPDIWNWIQLFKNNRRKLQLPDKNGPSKKDERAWAVIMREEAVRLKTSEQFSADHLKQDSSPNQSEFSQLFV